MAMTMTAPAAELRRAPLSLSFVRRVDVPFEISTRQLENLASSAEAGPDELRYHIELGRGLAHRAVPMELRVSRWSATLGVTLELLPQRHVRPTAEYFAAGQALLDELETVLRAR